MGSLSELENVSKDALADSGHEGLIVAMAGAIHAVPEQSDLERLLRASQYVIRLHVKYRIVLALTEMIEKGLVASSNIDRVQKVLDGFMQDADKPLTIRIERTRAFIAETARSAA